MKCPVANLFPVLLILMFIISKLVFFSALLNVSTPRQGLDNRFRVLDVVD